MGQKVASKKGTVFCATPSRLWFMNQGCKQVPLEHVKNKVRWGHPDGYFLNAKGRRLAENFPPSQYVHRGGSAYPKFTKDYNHLANHIAMAYAFYGERPTYVNKKGIVKPYQCHHVNGDKFDYRPINLLAWLHPDEHKIADKRQKKLKILVPDLHAFPIERLRILEDPHVTTDEQFEHELEQLRPGFVLVDPATIDDLELTKHYDPFIERD